MYYTQYHWVLLRLFTFITFFSLCFCFLLKALFICSFVYLFTQESYLRSLLTLWLGWEESVKPQVHIKTLKFIVQTHHLPLAPLTTDSDINHYEFLKFPNYCLKNKFKILTASRALAQPVEEPWFLCFAAEGHWLFGTSAFPEVKTHHTWTEQQSLWGQKNVHLPQTTETGPWC